MYVLYYYLVSFYFVQCILNDCIGLILFFGKHNGKSVNIKYKYNIQPFSLEIVQLINSLYCTIAGCCLNIYSIVFIYRDLYHCLIVPTWISLTQS